MRNRDTSRRTGPPARWRKVTWRWPKNAIRPVITSPTALAVTGVIPAPNASRLNSTTSATRHTSPTTPNVASSARRPRRSTWPIRFMPESLPAGRPVARLPFRRPLVEKGANAFLRVGELACGGHHLDRVVVGGPLPELELRVQRLFADRLALRAAAGHSLQ